jgi:hypothetical protein
MLRSARVQCDVVRSAGWDDIDDNHVKVGLVDQRSPHLGTCPRQSEMKPWPETVSLDTSPAAGLGIDHQQCNNGKIIVDD